MGEKKKGFTKKEWVTVAAFSTVNFANAVCVSLQAPFYPLEMETIGMKVLLNGGLIASGVSSIAFGMLDLVDSHGWFIGLSFVVRIIESLGTAASCIATFSITAVVFPDAVATTIAILEAFYGLGFIVGPTIGGYLFELGGYMCPFLAIGVFLLAVGVFILFALPGITDNKKSDEPPVEIVSVLRLWPVLLDLFAVTAMTISVGFFSATLEPHLRQFGLNPVSTGAMFILSGGTYAITAPLVGRLCDTNMDPKHLIICGSVLVIISFLLVGPVPYTPLEPALWMCILGLVIHGFGFSCILISAFIDALRSAIEFGLPDDINTYGIVSGMWASSFCLGGFIGPSVAGVLYDAVGFRPGTLFVIVVHAILFVTATWYVCVNPVQQVANSASMSGDKELEGQALDEFGGEDMPNGSATKSGYTPLNQDATVAMENNG